MIYNCMFEDNLFADQENPYQHLEMYEEVCWLQTMQELSQQVQAQMLSSTTAVFVDKPKSLKSEQDCLEFEPFEFQRTVQMTLERSLEDENQETGIFSSLTLDDQASATSMASNGFDFSQRQAEQNPEEHTGKAKGSGISFNTTDYIIKHCFKKMLDEDLREQVEPICEDNHLTYSGFIAFWRPVLKRYAPSKHIGLTRFIKMIGEEHPAVMVCRLFFSSYLMHEYPRYITVGSMHNKQEYLRCATKLMYISYPPKMGSKHIQHARKL